MIIDLPIDKKSFFYNINNDNKSGHTATVATNIKQGNTINEKLAKIIYIDNKLDGNFDCDDLVLCCTKNSKSQTKIVSIHTFSKFSINGLRFDCDFEFCIYVKKEIDTQKVQFGRMKMHYPFSFKYVNIDFNINNREVVKCISNILKGNAFLVNSFKYDMSSKVLDFDITILGYNGIPYSKVFINSKGAGNKFNETFNDFSYYYDTEIENMRKYFFANINTSNFNEYFTKCKSLAFDVIKEKFLINSSGDYIGDCFPSAPYDVEYFEGEVKKYLIIVLSTTKFKKITLSMQKLNFLNDFPEYTNVVLVDDLFVNKNISVYSADKLSEMNKTINSISFTEVD